MALTRVLRLSNCPPLHHCRRTFSTALNHTPVVFPTTINRESKSICSKRLIGSFIRHFSASPVVSDDMQETVSEDLILSVKSLRQDVESLRKEFSSLSEVVGTMQKCIAQRTACAFVSDYDGSENDNANGYVGDSLLNGNEKTIEKSNFSEAMATHYNSDSLEATRDSDSDGRNKEKATEGISDFSKAMATHFNTNIVISQDSQVAEKVCEFSEETRKGEAGDVIEEIRESDSGNNNQKVAPEEMSDLSEEIQKSDTEGNSEKATENMSDISEAMATQDTEIQKTETEGNETVPVVKEQNPLLKEIESEISRAVEFSHVSSQGVNFPDDFPFKLEDDVHGTASITLKGRYKLENIVVTVRTPSVFTPITTRNYNYCKSSNFIMKLTVEIFPAISEGREIAFECSAFSNGFIIENVYGSYGDKLVFRELNDNLQTQFKKYLETRGIKPSTTNCIFVYMLDKVNREKLRSLYKLKELVEA